MSENEKDYVVVTAISSHKIRYVMHKDDLQEWNPEKQVNMVEWAQDSVVCQDVEEFSQDWIGETILDTTTLTESEMLELFDKDNDYLKEWSQDYKIKWVRNNLKKPEQ
jgi:hypothetical protein